MHMNYIRPPLLPGSFSYLLSITTVFGHHLSQRLQNFDTQPLFIFLQQLLCMFDQSVHISLSLIYNIHTYMYMSIQSIFRAYLHIKPPLSHFLRESVFSGKSSSGRCRTSTRTDSSAWTSGRRRSSSADTMSCGSDKEPSLHLEWFNSSRIGMHITLHLQSLDDVPVVPWCGHHRVPTGSIASWKSPTHSCLLNNIVGFYKQVVHLVVQVHGDGDCSAFGCQGSDWETVYKQ